jgi:hypothetical protein
MGDPGLFFKLFEALSRRNEGPGKLFNFNRLPERHLGCGFGATGCASGRFSWELAKRLKLSTYIVDLLNLHSAADMKSTVASSA